MLEEIKRIENTATFKVFVVRIGLKNFDEYMKLFGDNIFQRRIATQWCLETYPNLSY